MRVTLTQRNFGWCNMLLFGYPGLCPTRSMIAHLNAGSKRGDRRSRPTEFSFEGMNEPPKLTANYFRNCLMLDSNYSA